MHRKLLLASYPHHESLLDTADRVRREGCKIYDAFTPYPVHGLSEVMGLRATRLGYITLLFGLAGLVLALGFQFYAAVLDWPVNVGGKPANSTLAFIPITFEITVLLGGLSTTAAFLLRARLLPGLRPRFDEPGVTEDTFVLAVLLEGGESDCRTRRILSESGALNTWERTVER